MDLDISARLAENFHKNKNEHNWLGGSRTKSYTANAGSFEKLTLLLDSAQEKKCKAAFLDLSYQSLQLYKKDLKFCSKFKSKILFIVHSSFTKNILVKYH